MTRHQCTLLCSFNGCTKSQEMLNWSLSVRRSLLFVESCLSRLISTHGKTLVFLFQLVVAVDKTRRVRKFCGRSCWFQLSCGWTVVQHKLKTKEDKLLSLCEQRADFQNSDFQTCENLHRSSNHLWDKTEPVPTHYPLNGKGEWRHVNITAGRKNKYVTFAKGVVC